MIPSPPLSTLLDSAIAFLAADIMSQSNAPDRPLQDKISLLAKTFAAAPHEKRLGCVEKLQQIMKSVDTNAALPLVKAIVRCDPVVMTKIVEDRMLAERVRHIYRVAEIAQIVSPANLRAVKGGIKSVKQKIFEVASE